MVVAIVLAGVVAGVLNVEVVHDVEVGVDNSSFLGIGDSEEEYSILVGFIILPFGFALVGVYFICV